MSNIKPYCWVDDHPLRQGTNGNLDPSRRDVLILFVLAQKNLGQIHSLPCRVYLANVSKLQLQMTVSRTGKVLSTESSQAIERQQASLKTITTEIELLRGEVEAKKITDKESPEEIEKWVGDIDEKLISADVELKRLQGWQDNVSREEKQRQREEQLEHERQVYEAKIKMKSELKIPSKSGSSKDEIQAKLPKLTITKFNGTFQDWTRFWNKFSETIDKTGIPNVTKFAYLRELLDANVRKTVEALPFTSEGYTRAKTILEEKYGKRCEIIKAYTKQILELPVIPNVNIKKIHEFYDTLMYAVQSLETMGGLQQVNGNVAFNVRKITRNSWRSYKSRFGLGKLGFR